MTSLQYERSYKELAQSVGVCKEHGAREPSLTEEMLTVSAEEKKPSNVRQSKRMRPFGSPFALGGNAQPSPGESPESAAAEPPTGLSPSQGSKLVNWLLPSNEERKTELTTTATQHLINAEFARRTCFDAWKVGNASCCAYPCYRSCERTRNLRNIPTMERWTGRSRSPSPGVAR